MASTRSKDITGTAITLGALGAGAWYVFRPGGLFAQWTAPKPEGAPGAVSATGAAGNASGSSQVSSTPARPIAPSNNSGASEGYFTYIIEPGDTLGGIASRFGIDLGVLQFDNGIPDPNVIYAGSPLKVRAPGTYGGAQRSN